MSICRLRAKLASLPNSAIKKSFDVNAAESPSASLLAAILLSVGTVPFDPAADLRRDEVTDSYHAEYVTSRSPHTRRRVSMRRQRGKISIDSMYRGIVRARYRHEAATDLQANHAIKAPDCNPPYLPVSPLSHHKNRPFNHTRIHARIVPRMRPTATLSPLSGNRTTRAEQIYSLCLSLSLSLSLLSPKLVDCPFERSMCNFGKRIIAYLCKR